MYVSVLVHSLYGWSHIERIHLTLEKYFPQSKREREKNNESIKLGHRTALLTSTANVVCVITEALLKLGGRHSNYLITGGLGKVILMHKLYPSRGNIGAAKQENVLLKTTQNWSKFKITQEGKYAHPHTKMYYISAAYKW